MLKVKVYYLIIFSVLLIILTVLLTLFVQKQLKSKKINGSGGCSTEQILNAKTKFSLWRDHSGYLPEEILADPCIPQEIKKASELVKEYFQKQEEINQNILDMHLTTGDEGKAKKLHDDAFDKLHAQNPDYVNSQIILRNL